MDQGLSIIIGADVKQALSGLNQVEGALDTTNLSIGESVKKLDLMYQALNRTMNPELVKQYQASIDNLESHISDLQSQSQKVGEALKQMPQGGGGSGFASSLSAQRVALVDLGRIATGTSFTIRSLGSQLALLPLPVVAATAAVALLGVAFIKLSLSQSDAEKAQAKVNETMGAAGASAEGEIAEIQDLASIITSETSSRELRSDAFKKLQDQYPNALKNFDLEKSSTADLLDITGKLTDALLRQAQIKGLESAISEIYSEQAKLLTESTEKVLENASAFDKLKAAIVGAGAVGLTGFSNAANFGAAQIIGDSYKSNADQIAVLNSKLKDLLTTSLKLNDSTILGTSVNNVAQNANLSYLEKTKTLIESLDKKDSTPLFKQEQNLDESGTGKSVAGSIEGSLAEVNFDIYKQNLAKATSDAATGAISEDTFAQYKKALDAAFQHGTSPNLTSPIKLQLDDTGIDPQLEPIKEKIDKLGSIKLQFDESKMNAALTILNDSMSSIASKFESNAIISVAQAVGTALGKGGSLIKAAENSLLAVLGEALENLGKALLEYGAAQEAAKFAMSSLDPEIAIIAGVIAEVAGAALKGIAGGGTAFAEGGIVTAPTLGLVGEAGPEVIFPLSKLQQFVKSNSAGSAGTHVTGDFRLQGQDLVVAFDRAQKNRKLV